MVAKGVHDDQQYLLTPPCHVMCGDVEEGGGLE